MRDMCLHLIESEKDRLIASVLPEINCPPHCYLCCEYPLSMAWADYGCTDVQIWEDDRDTPCKSFTREGCAVYEKRPFVCRIFWKEEFNPVCHAGKSVDRLLTHEEFARVMWCWDKGTLQDARALVAYLLITCKMERERQ